MHMHMHTCTHTHTHRRTQVLSDDNIIVYTHTACDRSKCGCGCVCACVCALYIDNDVMCGSSRGLKTFPVSVIYKDFTFKGHRWRVLPDFGVSFQSAVVSTDPAASICRLYSFLFGLIFHILLSVQPWPFYASDGLCYCNNHIKGHVQFMIVLTSHPVREDKAPSLSHQHWKISHSILTESIQLNSQAILDHDLNNNPCIRMLKWSEHLNWRCMDWSELLLWWMCIIHATKHWTSLYCEKSGTFKTKNN